LTARRAFRRPRARLRDRSQRSDNRRRAAGWLAPSLRHRPDNVLFWVRRLCRLAPVGGMAMELVRFDLQKIDVGRVAIRASKRFNIQTAEQSCGASMQSTASHSHASTAMATRSRANSSPHKGSSPEYPGA